MLFYLIQRVLLFVYNYCVVWKAKNGNYLFTSRMMLCHVLLQVDLLNCPKRTKVTRERLLPGVNSYVGLKIRLLCRSIGAVRTCKGLFAGMRSDVVHHGGHLGHGAVTVGTFVAGCLSAAGGVT